MREKLEQLLAKIKETNEKLSRRNRLLVIACIAAVIIIAVVSAFILNSNKGTPLFTELAQAEALEIMGKLQDMGVAASYSNGTILVPDSQADTLRAQLVMLGYPQTGFSYTVFKDNVGMMSTDSDRETYKLYDLQDRIASTIRHFSGIDDAVVFISTGNDSKYVLEKNKQDPSASVTVFMKNGATPDANQVKGMQRLIASAYPGMKTENVAVIDGMTFSDVTDQKSATELQSGAARLKIALETDIERSVQSKVTNLLNPVFGPERVRVSVNCEVDVKKKIREIINYIPVNENDPRGVLQREQTGVEAVGQGSVTYGVPGTETNAQIPIYPNITSDGTEIYYTDDKAFDYLVSQIKEQIQDEGGDILNLSVGVVIDEERLSRTQKEDLRQVVAQAAGINIAEAEQKVSIVNATFYNSDKTATGNTLIELLNQNPNLKWILLGALGALLVLIVLVILILRRSAQKKKQKLEEEAAALAAEAAALAAEAAAEEDDILNTPLDQARRTREMELKQQIGEFADMNPEIVAQLIKTWLKGGSSDE